MRVAALVCRLHQVIYPRPGACCVPDLGRGFRYSGLVSLHNAKCFTILLLSLLVHGTKVFFGSGLIVRELTNGLSNELSAVVHP